MIRKIGKKTIITILAICLIATTAIVINLNNKVETKKIPLAYTIMEEVEPTDNTPDASSVRRP